MNVSRTLVLVFTMNSIALATADERLLPVHSLTVGEGFVEPLGYHDPTPRFSWKLPGDAKRQTGYRLEVSSDGIHWESAWIESDQSVLVPYGGDPFASRSVVHWRVQIRDGSGRERPWSKKATFELGLLSKADWQARWIRPATGSDPKQERVAWMQRAFSLNDDIVSARLHIAARGVFEVEVNGSRVGRDHFANGFTPFDQRLDSLTYDVTDQLRAGNNLLQVMLGTGWYAGRIAWRDQVGIYGQQPELLLQLEITSQNGEKVIIASDEHWEATREGPLLSSSIYDGEHYDARKPLSGWSPVAVNASLGDARLAPKPFAPVRQIETLAPKRITEPEPGRYVFDLGQNMVGWARIKVPVTRDSTVTLRTSEMLKADGTLYTEAYRSAKSTDRYTAAETGIVEWEPTFTFHGFRYVELSGLPKDARPQSSWVTGVVLHSDLKPIGTFSSSHGKLNRLQSNIVWGQRGNFLDIPTDCPQRDERLGWTGDAQVFCPTSMFNYDSHAFWKSWLASMRDDQMPDGRIPHVIPDVLNEGNSPGWMDAATIVPWEVYVRTGDTEVLAENLSMMEKLVGAYRGQAVDGLITEITAFGDWLQPYADTRRGDTPAPLLGTAFYAHSAELLAKSARVLGQDDLAQRYQAESDQVKQAFAGHYFDADVKLRNAPETQTAYLLAIEFDLIPKALQSRAAENLVRLVEAADGHLRTGFLGTPYIVSTLDRMGYHDLAYDLLLKETYPSWFYSINQGATTMWERWNSYSHEHGFGDVKMNSFNHYAYGAIGQWLYERVAGLAPDPDHPGYKHFYIQPLIGGGLEWADARLETPYGPAASSWERTGNKVVLQVSVPPNTTATIVFPTNRTNETVGAGSYQFELELD